MGARPQQAGETENGTERFATSTENRNGLTAFLVSFSGLLEEMDRRYDGIGVREMVVKIR
jgi:hypothetical protein